MHVHELLPKILADSIIAAAARDPDFVYWSHDPEWKNGYRTHTKPWFILPPAIRHLRASAVDLIGFKNMGNWAAQGPKTFIPTLEQCRALEQVEVNIPLVDYTQPYPALCVKLPKGIYDPFLAIICYLDVTGGPSPMLSCAMLSKGNLQDVVTTIAHTGDIEESLQKFDVDCNDVQHVAPLALRVAVNSCLVLTNYEHRLDMMYPAEYASDAHLAEEDSERGQRARLRVRIAPQRVSFVQNITLHRSEHRDGTGEPTGRELPFGWRKGHWAMQPYGAGSTLRKRIFRRPCMVRPDKLVGDAGGTSVTYRG